MSVTIYKFFILALFLCRSSADVNNRYYPRYHLAPPYGWMNDPNGFSIYKDEYHLFYQFNPKSSQDPGTVHWGHAKSNDLFHWEHLPIAMYPDQSYDKDGVFSGSVIVENETMYMFYTGDLQNPAEEHQVLAISTDGVNVTKYTNNPIIKGNEYQPNFRDPKAWKHDNTYYMVLGNSFDNNTLGRALLYASKNMISWEEVSVLDESDGSTGYMWECPDFFELDGKFVLLFSPQGMRPTGDKYKNLYQTGYVVGNFNYTDHVFTPLTEFRELDNGHDFYATQTLLEPSGRRIMVAWFDMWETNYPDKNDGFNGHITLPRVLSLSDEGRLLQMPVKEIDTARGQQLYFGKAHDDVTVFLNDNSAEVNVWASHNKDLDLIIESADKSDTVKISYDFKRGRVTLDRGGQDGVRRTKWRAVHKLKWKIFIDASSIEVFCGEGEVTFSSRIFPAGPLNVRLGAKSEASLLTVHTMERTIPLPGSN